MHADRTNRAMLLLIAVLLLAIGLAGALIGLGAFGSDREHRIVFDNRVSRYFGEHGDWLWPLVALAALIIGLLALRWLIALLFSTDRVGELRLSGDQSAGKTILRSGALTEAVADEVETYPGVHGAHARLIGDADAHRLVLAATIEDTADLAGLRRRIETNAVAHARDALGNPDLPVQLDLTTTVRKASRVS
jgi:hypothetical protein